MAGKLEDGDDRSLDDGRDDGGWVGDGLHDGWAVGGPFNTNAKLVA